MHQHFAVRSPSRRILGTAARRPGHGSGLHAERKARVKAEGLDYDAILFDCDGVLVDTGMLIASIVAALSCAYVPGRAATDAR